MALINVPVRAEWVNDKAKRREEEEENSRHFGYCDFAAGRSSTTRIRAATRMGARAACALDHVHGKMTR